MRHWYTEQEQMKAAMLALVASVRSEEAGNCDGEGPGPELTTALQAAEKWFSTAEIAEAELVLYERERARIEAERQKRSPTDPKNMSLEGLATVSDNREVVDLMKALRKGLQRAEDSRKTGPDGGA